MIRFAPLAIAALVVVGTRTADAHQTSVKYVDVAVDGNAATIALTVAPGDVTEPLGLPADARPSVAEATTPKVAAYVAGWATLGCPAGPASAAPDADGKFVVVTWHVTCDAEIEHVVLDLRALFAIDARQEAIVTVHERGQPGDAVVVRSSDPELRMHVAEQHAGIGGWIAAGTDHIWEGRDHVCFVLSLLLVVMLVRTDRWATYGPVQTLKHTATIVTAFTVAHSISLIAASLGWVRLPGAFVEAAIAVSILYTAIENIVKPDVPWRFVVTFVFGLVHGLGFASVLAVMLPPDHVIAPLLGFNVGVELGQLAIVAVALPVFWLAARELGPDRYRRYAMPAVSSVIALVAMKWLIERVFGLVLPTFWGI